MSQYRFRLSLAVENDYGERRRYAADVPCDGQPELIDRLAFAVVRALEAAGDECQIENVVIAATRRAVGTELVPTRLAQLGAVARLLLLWDGYTPLHECVSVVVDWAKLVGEPDESDARDRRSIAATPGVASTPGSPDWSHLLPTRSS